MKVLVTGANGHVGNGLARSLATRGYKVRASVRDARDASKTAALDGAGIADIVSLDIRDPEAFAQAADGIEIIFHVAATYALHIADAQSADDLLRDSLEGTRSAISAAKSCGARKVVMTSSVVTLPLSESRDTKVNESAWRDDLRLPYFRAKTEAERLAWKLSQEAGVPLVTILPGAVLGPGFHRRTSSTDLIESMMLGSMRFGAPPGDLPVIDVRDVAEAHFLAAEKECEGRFIIAPDISPDIIEINRIAHGIDRRIPKAPMVLPRFMLNTLPFFDWLNHRLLGAPRSVSAELVASALGKHWALSNERARNLLGWTPTIPLEETLAETIRRLRELRGET
jgi:dihydroflavonol-4-reductase